MGLLSDIGATNAVGNLGETIYRGAQNLGAQRVASSASAVQNTMQLNDMIRQQQADAMAAKAREEASAINAERLKAERHANREAPYDVLMNVAFPEDRKPEQRKFIDEQLRARGIVLDGPAGRTVRVSEFKAEMDAILKDDRLHEKIFTSAAMDMAASKQRTLDEMAKLKAKAGAALYDQNSPEYAKYKELAARSGQQSEAYDALVKSARMANPEYQKQQASIEAKLNEPYTLAPGARRYVGDQMLTENPKDVAEWEDAGTIKVGEKTIRVQRNKTTNELKAIGSDEPNRPAVQISIGEKLDMEAARGTIKELPKMRDAAVIADNSIKRIDTMLGLIDKGAAGKLGQVLAVVGPYAQAMGINTKGMNDAQTYDLLAKTIGGSMRTDIVGPGQVSNYENQLLQKISGGGGTAPAAARELLNYYKGIANNTVQKYNDSVSSVSEISPTTGKLYKKIGGGASPAPAPATGTRFRIIEVK